MTKLKTTKTAFLIRDSYGDVAHKAWVSALDGQPRGENIECVNVFDCEIKDADFSDSTLSLATFVQCVFRRCCFNRTIFEGCRLNCCRFIECSLVETKFHRAPIGTLTMLCGNSFESSALSNVDFTGATITPNPESTANN